MKKLKTNVTQLAYSIFFKPQKQYLNHEITFFSMLKIKKITDGK